MTVIKQQTLPPKTSHAARVTWSQDKPQQQLMAQHLQILSGGAAGVHCAVLSLQSVFLAGFTAPGLPHLVHFGPSQRPGQCQTSVRPPRLWGCRLRPTAGGFQICLLQAAQVRAHPWAGLPTPSLWVLSSRVLSDFLVAVVTADL